MAKYQHINNGQTREMSKEDHKKLPNHIQSKWKEVPASAVAKKKPAEAGK